MKTPIRALCLILFFLLAGCSAANEIEIAPEYKTLEGIDYGERVFLLSTFIDNYDLCYITETPLAEITLDRLSTIGKTYNCTVKPVFVAGAESEIMAQVAGNSCDFDIYFNDGQGAIFTLGTAGVLEDLSYYDDILNFERGNDEKWGSVYVRELGMIAGKQYGLTPYSWPAARPAVAGIMGMNESLITQFAKTNPREMVENGTWTWDNFVTYIEDCTFTDAGKQYFGFYVNNYRDVISAAFLANGCDVVKVASDGSFTSDLQSESGIKAIDWAMSLYKEHINCFFGNKQNFALDNEAEMQQIDFNSIFTFHTTSFNFTDYYSYRVDAQLGLIPFPSGPDGEYGNWSGFTYGEYAFALYSTGEEQEASARIISDICEPFEQYPDNDALLSYYMSNIFYDSRDAEFFLEINNNSKYTCNYWPVSGHTFWNNLGTTTQTASEFIEANIDKQLAIIEEHMLPNAIYIKELLAD